MELSPERRIAGILAPLFALRSEDDLGIGDTASLRHFVDWAADHGFGLVQLLPVNETGGDNSPYNAVSSIALDPTTIEVSPTAIPELTARDYKAVLGKYPLKEMRSGAVDYVRVKQLKHDLLGRACARLDRATTGRQREFAAFQTQEVGWLRDYTLFRVLMEQHGSEMWDHWPREQATAKKAWDWLSVQPAARRSALKERMRYFAYVQWIAFSQWRELRAHCDQRNVALMGDIPIGVSYYSSDVFSLPQLFDLTWSGGAPPERVFKADPFTAKWGQNWGVPKYRWDVMRGDQFEWWKTRVRAIREVFHLFRIDHILGFYRFFSFPWRPSENESFLPLSEGEARARCGGRLPGFLPRPDETPEQCDANRREGEEYLGHLLGVVGEHRLVGEDLGVVPPYVRPSLASLGIAGFKVPQWEREGNGPLTDGADYPRLSVTAYATHDHAPMKVQWNQWSEVAQAGGIHSPEFGELQRLAAFAHVQIALPHPWTDGIHEALLRALFASNAWMAIAMITDLFASEQRFNVPGTISDKNWAERLPKTFAELRADPDICGHMEMSRRLLVETGRASGG